MIAHPLDPLTAAELGEVAAIIREHYGFGSDLRIETIDTEEPDRAVVRGFKSGTPIPRIARYNVFKRGLLGVWQGRADLGTGNVVSDTFVETARAMVATEEVLEIESLVKADARFQEGLRRRGVLDKLDLVCVDPWPAGNFGDAIEQGRRVLYGFAFLRVFPLDNHYAHPIEGLHALIDVGTMEILYVEDHFEAKGDFIPVPMTPHNYDSAILTEYRKPSIPLDVVQPQGAGFKVEGRRVTWENWDFHVGFNGREGLVLGTIGYAVDGCRRPIVYRASIAEMVVPYGAPDGSHHRKNVFDHGENGFGRLVNSLRLGCDCLGVIHYFDAHMPDVFGNVRTIENAICLHEEDAGLAWKHTDVRSGRVEVRRARKLVISSISTVGNYEYACYWYLHQDGRIEFEMKATGIINTSACLPGRPGKYANEVAPGVRGYIHQHIFNARLDMEVDGPRNTVVESNTLAPPPGPDNPHGNAFFVEDTVLASELAARRNVNFDTMRYWKVINSELRNAVGNPTGYRLESRSPVRPFLHPDGPSGRRSAFIEHQLWVTPYRSDERYPAGEFVSQSTGDDGLPAWTVQDRPVQDAEIVLWHNFGLHHPVRPEDHPVQPCIACGFTLVPDGFFDRNPIIDLPPAMNQSSCCASMAS